MILIRDKTDTPQQLPMSLFLKTLRKLSKNKIESIYITRSEGYGLTINKWNDQLQNKDSIIEKFDDLLNICENDKEWFYWLQCKIPDNEIISFGIIDSTGIYIEASNTIETYFSNFFNDIEKVKL